MLKDFESALAARRRRAIKTHKIRVNPLKSKLAKQASKRMGAAARSKAAKQAAKTRRPYQHKINQRISKSHKR